MADDVKTKAGQSEASGRAGGAADAGQPGSKGQAATTAEGAGKVRAGRIKPSSADGPRADVKSDAPGSDTAADAARLPAAETDPAAQASWAALSAPADPAAARKPGETTGGKGAGASTSAPAEKDGKGGSAVATTSGGGDPGKAGSAKTAAGKAVANAAGTTPGDGGKGGSGKPARSSLIGRLDADQRLRQTAERHERTLWAGAVAATLVYALLIIGQAAGLPIFAPSEAVQEERERRGQGAPDSISVEIVPDPDFNSKTKRWREGSNQPADQQAEEPPQQAQPAPPEPVQETDPEPVPEEQKPEPEPEKEKAEAEDKPAEEKKTEEAKAQESPLLLDIDSLVDAAAQDLKKQIDEHYDARRQRQQRRQQQARASGAMQVRGTGASGRDDPFTRSVLAALMKTRPGPFALWGRVLVSFEISETGRLLYVRVLQSSGNTALDDAAIDAIKRAQFKKPPPGLSSRDRTYIIDYIFG